MNPDTAKGYLDWLIAEIGFQTQYHNHKETMAWVITAFYVPGIVISAEYGQEMAPVFLIPYFKWIIVLLAVLAFCFIMTQLYLRRKAAAYTMALMQTVSELYKDSSKVPLGKLATAELKHWPELIEERAKHLKFRARRWTMLTTDVVTILVFLIASGFAITLVWS